MATITIELPSLLRPLAQGQRALGIDAISLCDALDQLARHHPALFKAVCDESGRFRPHVLCFVNGTNTRWFEPSDMALVDGDVVRFLQAVSGG